MRLIFDQMLRRPATWCRILGIDSEYFTGKDDKELLEHAKKNKCIVVTRDVELSNRCRKAGLKFVFVTSDVPEEQVAQTIKESGARVSFPENTRCTVCNGRLEAVSREDVKEDIPKDVYESEKRTWRCGKCKKAYWEGSHWRNIEKFWKKIKNLL